MKKLALCGALLCASFAVTPERPSEPAEAAGQDDRANVLLIMVDDMAKRDKGLANIRGWFGENGTRFTNANISNPLCCPSRASILTGQYGYKNGMWDNKGPEGGYQAMDHADSFVPALQSSGYSTGHVGKYMNQTGSAVPPGYDTFQNMDTYSFYGQRWFLDGVQVEYPQVTVDGTPGQHVTTTINERSLDVLDGFDDDQPWFLTISHLAPHIGFDRDAGEWGPPVATPENRDLYDNRSMPTDPRINPDSIDFRRPDRVTSRPKRSQAQMNKMEENWRASSESLKDVDDTWPQILGALQARGDLDNTIVIFMSDHGYNYGEHRKIGGKQEPYRNTVEVPLFVAGPGFEAGVDYDGPVSNVDIAPTALAAAGLGDGIDYHMDPNYDMHGRALQKSFTNVWLQRAVLIERYNVHCYQGLVTQDYKYIRYATGETELFDYTRGKWELKSRVHPDYNSVRVALRQRMDNHTPHAGNPPCLNS